MLSDTGQVGIPNEDRASQDMLTVTSRDQIVQDATHYIPRT